MKSIFDIGNRYIEESDWKVIAGVKFCLFSMGMMAGMRLPEKYKKPAYTISMIVFISTYIPLMKKLILIIKEEFES